MIASTDQPALDTQGLCDFRIVERVPDEEHCITGITAFLQPFKSTGLLSRGMHRINPDQFIKIG
jgi:hypothetical protein